MLHTQYFLLKMVVLVKNKIVKKQYNGSDYYLIGGYLGLIYLKKSSLIDLIKLLYLVLILIVYKVLGKKYGSNF